MTVLYILVPVAIVFVILAICIFNWAVNNGQYDDLDSPAHSILFDEQDPAHLSASKPSDSSSDTQRKAED